MLRYIVRGTSQLSRQNSRSLQSSVILNNKDDETKKESDKKFWESEFEEEDPYARTYRVMNKQWRELKNRIQFWKDSSPVDTDEWGVDSANIHTYTDVVIIGSGAIANSAAYWIKKRAGESLATIVIEPKIKNDLTSLVLSAGGFRQQYSMEENIEMSLFTADFLRNINDYLGIEGQPPIDINYHPFGCLQLATEAGAEQLQFNSKLQNSKGAANQIFTAAQLKLKFPWLNTDNIALGCLGLCNEGWFNSDILVDAMKRKAFALGVEYSTGDVKGFVFGETPNIPISTGGYKEENRRSTNHVVIKTEDGRKRVIEFAIIVLAAGHETGRIARLAKIGKCSGMLSVPLPVVPRKRHIYYAHAPGGPGLNTPITFDPTGCFFKRTDLINNYIVGRDPQHPSEEPSIHDLNVDPNYFFDHVWPALSYRVPSFENIKVTASHTAYYDYCTYDETGVIGNHPVYNNMVFATGFGANTIQHSPAIGRAVSEEILDSRFRTIDLTRFGFERFMSEEPQIEAKIA
ncbi:hypothetical protein PV327_005078 [Microctonus hyperodae]|uniref:FAD-dependent oxidoreductase domain-containing protein 1 n=1 Tax=Microctonus hyperodae TaxID=165561 RepID=A0AA39G217_MICHY|nr:hypothetical protein PV327_005078 [Microctonus hyperodae]